MSVFYPCAPCSDLWPGARAGVTGRLSAHPRLPSETSGAEQILQEITPFSTEPMASPKSTERHQHQVAAFPLTSPACF